MEPTMISFKALSTAALVTLVLPMAAPTASFAENPHGTRVAPSGSVRAGVGAPPPRFTGNVAAPRTFSGGRVIRTVPGAPVAQSAPNGGNWRGNEGWRGGEGWRDGHRERDRGFIPGVVVGAVIGGALASQNYGGPVYYAPRYTDDQYYDGNAVAPAGDDAVAYCIQNYSSYDPDSGTYLGNDGYRHPCP
jgi:hypothetical protein